MASLYTPDNIRYNNCIEYCDRILRAVKRLNGCTFKVASIKRR